MVMLPFVRRNDHVPEDSITATDWRWGLLPGGTLELGVFSKD